MPIDVPIRDRCPFCNFLSGGGNWAVVDDQPDTIAFLPARQSGTGHVLVIPKCHATTLIDLERAEAASIMVQVHRIAHAIVKAYDPAGLNVYQNNGATAGQSVPHYHVHLVPSYPGDPPGRIFRPEDVERRPFEELLEIASRIRAHLEPHSP